MEISKTPAQNIIDNVVKVKVKVKVKMKVSGRPKGTADASLFKKRFQQLRLSSGGKNRNKN